MGKSPTSSEESAGLSDDISSEEAATSLAGLAVTSTSSAARQLGRAPEPDREEDDLLYEPDPSGFDGDVDCGFDFSAAPDVSASASSSAAPSLSMGAAAAASSASSPGSAATTSGSPQRDPRIRDVFARDPEDERVAAMLRSPAGRGLREARDLTPYLATLYRNHFHGAGASPLKSGRKNRRKKSPIVDEDEVPNVRKSCRGDENWSRTISMGAYKEIDQRDNLIDLQRRFKPSEIEDERIREKVGPEGISNLELMDMGHAPIGPGDIPIELHHWYQQDPGPLGELSGSLHERENYVLHFTDDGVGRQRRDFRNFRKKYWKARARQLREMYGVSASSSSLAAPRASTGEQASVAASASSSLAAVSINSSSGAAATGVTRNLPAVSASIPSLSSSSAAPLQSDLSASQAWYAGSVAASSAVLPSVSAPSTSVSVLLPDQLRGLGASFSPAQPASPTRASGIVDRLRSLVVPSAALLASVMMTKGQSGR